MIKIAFFSDLGLPYVGGGQRYVQCLGSELIKLGIDVHWMYTRLPNTKKEEIIDGINCHRIDIPFGRTFFPVFSIPYANKLAKEVDILQFDTFYAGMSGWISGKMSKKPYLLAVYEMFQDLWNILAKNKIQAWFYRSAENYLANSPYPVFLTISEYTKRRLISLGTEKKLIKVVYPGIDHKLFHPHYERSFRKKHKLDKKIVLGWVGRMNLSQSKNLPMLIEAFKIVKKEMPNTVLAFDGPDFQNLMPIIRENSLKLGEDIIYNGCVKRIELPKFYSSLDLYVCSSLSEGFGLSVAEAEACGVPAVCFDAGSLPEVVKDKKTGIVVKEKNAEALADGIIKMVGDKEKLRKYGKSAAEWSKVFDWEKTAKGNLEVYRNLIENF